METNNTTNEAKLGGRFTFPGTKLTVHRMGYGAMQLSGPGIWGPPKDPDAAITVLREAIAAGVDHIDTSDFYGPHITNQIIKQALHPYPARTGDRHQARRTPPCRQIMAARHLARGTHRRRPRQPPQPRTRRTRHRQLSLHGRRPRAPSEGSIAEQVNVLAGLQRAGLIRHIGLSNVTATQIAEAQAITDIVCVQNNYNLAHRHDDALIDDLARQGIPYVPFFPALGGFTAVAILHIVRRRWQTRLHPHASRARHGCSAPVAQHPA